MTTPVTWKINGNDAATLGINVLSLKTVNQAPGEFSFQVPGNMAANTAYPYRSTVTLLRNSTCWFRGVVTTVPRAGEPRRETIQIVAQDAWYYLDNITFEQDWSVWSDGAVVSASKARCILGRNKAGEQQTNGQVIREALSWAIGSGAPIQIGTIEPSAQIPATEDQDITCSQVIQQMLRWSPDTVCYWTYNGTTPVFNCRYRRNLPAATFNLNEGAPNSTVEITARPDLQLPAVVLKYEKTNSNDNNSYSTIEIDKYPTSATGREIGAFVGTVNLSGFSQSFMYQRVETANIATGTEEWWQLKFPWMADRIKYPLIKVYAIARSGAKCPDGESSSGEMRYKVINDLPRELIDGQVLDWMQKDAGEETVTAKVHYKQVNEDGTEEEVEDQDIAITITATDATTRKYWRMSSYSGAETTPSGLAQELYTSCAAMHYQGSISIIEQECTGKYALGQVLNLMGGISEWTAMKALVQSVSYHLDSGTTTVNIGPPQQLGFADLVELLKVTRNSRPSMSVTVRESGDIASSDSTIPGGQNAPRSNSTQGPPQYAKLVIRKGEKAIILDPSLPETELILFTALELQDDGIHTKTRTLKFYGATPYEIGAEETGPILPGGPCPNGT